MRLIDADELLENYDLKNATKYGNKSAKQQEHSYSTLMMYEIADMIEDAPTVYDVEAIVKELKKASYFTRCLGSEVRYVNLDKAIEIVKKGGVKK